MWGRVADLVGRHPRRTWVITLVVLLAAAAFAPTFKASGSDHRRDLPRRHRLDRRPAGRSASTSRPGRRRRSRSSCPRPTPRPRSPSSPRTPASTAPTSGSCRRSPVSPPVPPKVVDGTVLIQATTKAASDSQEAEDTVAAAALPTSTPSAPTRSSAATPRPTSTCTRRAGATCGSSCPTILLVIFVVLALLLRSIVAPLLLVAANVVSFAATIGISALVFEHVFGFTSSDPSIVLYGFVFLVALGIDYSIFLMTRVREESKVPRHQTRHPRSAWPSPVASSPARASCSRRPSRRWRCCRWSSSCRSRSSSAFGVLLDTFVVRSLLVPAAAYDIGPPVWWPRHLRRRPRGGAGLEDDPSRRPGRPRLSRMTRVALAGYGFAGRDIHAPLLAEAGCDVVAVSTRNPERAAAARDDIPGVQVVAGLDELLAVPGLDLVVLATPSGGHAAQVRAVVDAGLPCVVDKPLAVDAASAADVVRYAAASGVPLTVFQNRRFDAEQATVARVVADGLVGTPFRYEMRWERWRPVPKERWREQASASGRRRHPARPAQPPRRRRGAAVRPGRDGVRHGRRPHHPGRGRRVPGLPARRRGGVAPRRRRRCPGHPARGCGCSARRRPT